MIGFLLICLAAAFPAAASAQVAWDVTGIFHDGSTLSGHFTSGEAGPERATWLLLIAGFGVIGWLLRRHLGGLSENDGPPAVQTLAWAWR
jgi:hypothetical protein